VDFPAPDGTDPVPFKLRTEESKTPKPIPAINEAYQFEVLSLDVFDTVLKRRCHHPKDIFRFLEVRAIRELGLPRKPYALAREQAEALARETVRPDVSNEVTLEEIYEFVAKLCGLKAKEAEKLMALELALEKQYLYGDPRWVDLYSRLKKSGQRIVFVSDMYLKSDTIRDLLDGCGFPEAEVYVSCELHASKHEGTLQEKVVSALNVEPGSILHVGDNFHSDYLKTVHAGWQAFYWSPEYSYRPWYAETDPFVYNSHDLLSPRIMGEVSRLGLLRQEEDLDLVKKLGLELAGPFYLSYLLWVVREAKKDGVQKLLLIGRDGYYWEKTLRLISEKEDLGIEFSYLHASRKVFNFASYFTLDETAIEFLSTPNPALRVRDFIDRTGLDSSQFVEFMKMAGFDDPDEVLTTEMGGRYLQDHYQGQLEKLFRLLKPELETLFAEDRAGTLKVLKEAGYNHEDCAFVDIGWNGSCIRPFGRLLGLDQPEQIKAYFFGTWQEATQNSEHVQINSFFMHLGEPLDHFLLIRESVNLLESLNAAPFPTLLAFHSEGDEVVPTFSKHLKSGFSVEQQERLWAGAELFLRTILENGLPELGETPGHCYLFLTLNRLLREPAPSEVGVWGNILHSDGFGIEVYKRLVEPVDEKMTGPELMSAYKGSNWKRGFLSTLSNAQRQFVLERIEDQAPKTFEQLRSDLEYKIRQADELWGEKEQYKWQVNHLREMVSRLEKDVDKLQGDLKWKSQQTDEFWAENERNKAEARAREEELQLLRSDFEARQKELEALIAKLGSLENDLDEANRLAGQLHDQLEAASTREAGLTNQVSSFEEAVQSLNNQVATLEEEVQTLNNQIATLESERNSLQLELEQLRGYLAKRGNALKIFFSGKIPKKD
jgi:FMN phosphatase YigB (HAD superfamily)